MTNVSPKKSLNLPWTMRPSDNTYLTEIYVEAKPDIHYHTTTQQ